MKLILSYTTILTFTACDNNVEFTRIIVGTDSCSYMERVLVKNIPRNNVIQSKIMISYFDSIGLSINNLVESPEIKYYHIFFYKSTDETRRYFIDKNFSVAYDGNETYLGSIGVLRCKRDSTKWKIEISRNLGTAENYDIQGPQTEEQYLQNECDSIWYRHDKHDNLVTYYGVDKNNELVKYYMELKNKKL